MSQDTELVFWLDTNKRGEKNYLPAWSARGCTQTFQYIQTPAFKRTVNGDLVDIGGTQHRKYRTTISCQDRVAPAFEAFWSGTRLWVDCIQLLTVPLAPKETELKLGRQPVPDSWSAETLSGETIQIYTVEDLKVTLKAADEKGYFSYRPCLSMMLASYQLKTDEWGMTVGWDMVLEEV